MHAVPKTTLGPPSLKWFRRLTDRLLTLSALPFVSWLKDQHVAPNYANDLTRERDVVLFLKKNADSITFA